MLIFDEIQECNSALNSLKYFYEDSPEYVVVAAGSLLGVALTKGESFPVGKVDFLDLYPLTFKEFLKTANEKLYNYVEELSENISFTSILLQTALASCTSSIW